MKLPTQIDIKTFFESLIGLYRKDAISVGLFTAAVAKKTMELAIADPTRLAEFVYISTDLSTRYINRGFDVAKNPFGWLFKDPFKELRAETRTFAATWDLDSEFRKIIGP